MRNLLIIALLLCSTTLLAGDVGRLSGRFVLDGPRPLPKVHVRGIKSPGPVERVDQSLKVDLETHGVENILVSLYVKPDEKGPPAVPAKDDSIVLRMSKHRFEPRILLMRAGQKLIMENADGVKHNLTPDLLANAPFNIDVEPRKSIGTYLHKGEYRPVAIHNMRDLWMRGYLYVSDHPYVALTDRSGRFVIDDVPLGEWHFRVWHERSGNIEQVELDGRQVRWERGLFAQKITAGENDLGWISVAPEELAEPK